jgi:hypothetical protein
MVRTLVFDKLVNDKLKRLLDDNKSKTGLIIGFVSSLFLLNKYLEYKYFRLMKVKILF